MWRNREKVRGGGPETDTCSQKSGELVWLSRVDESKGSRWRHTQGSQVLMRTLAFSLLSEV